jgi:hypothetical protein
VRRSCGDALTRRGRPGFVRVLPRAAVPRGVHAGPPRSASGRRVYAGEAAAATMAATAAAGRAEPYAWPKPVRGAILAALAPLRAGGALANATLWAPAAVVVDVSHTALGAAQTPDEVAQFARESGLDAAVRAALAPLSLQPAPTISYQRFQFVSA